MKTKSRKNNNQNTARGPLASGFLSVITGIYLLLLFVIFPLYYERGFSNLGDAKWRFFRIITFYSRNRYFVIPTFLFLAAVGFIWFCIDMARRKELKAFLLKGLNAADIFVLSYGILTGFACIITPYRKYFFWGFPTWYMGLLMQTALVILYFLVSRVWKWDDKAFLVFMAASLAVIIIALLNYFNMDPLGFYTAEGTKAGGLFHFTSTIGQRTMYSGYLMTVFPMGVFLYWAAEKRWIKILSFVFIVIGFMSIITQNSDSALLGLVGMYAVLFWFSFMGNRYMKSFLEIILIMLLSWKTIGYIQSTRPELKERMRDMMLFGTQSNIMWVLITGVAVLYIVLLLLIRNKKDFDVSSLKIFRNIMMGLFFLSIILVILYIILNTKGLLPESLSFGKGADGKKSSLFFDNSWGHDRGLFWTISMKAFLATLKDDIPTFIFGAGPDEFREITVHYCEDMTSKMNTVLNCAHNEWLDRYVNGGILGGTAYLGIFISSFVIMFRKAEEHPELVAVLLCSAAYFFHNIFCYQRLTCTPFIFVFIAAGISIVRNGGMPENR